MSLKGTADSAEHNTKAIFSQRMTNAVDPKGDACTDFTYPRTRGRCPGTRSVAGLCVLSHWLSSSYSVSACEDGRFTWVREALAEPSAGVEPRALQRAAELLVDLDTELCISTR